MKFNSINIDEGYVVTPGEITDVVRTDQISNVVRTDQISDVVKVNDLSDVVRQGDMLDVVRVDDIQDVVRTPDISAEIKIEVDSLDVMKRGKNVCFKKIDKPNYTERTFIDGDQIARKFQTTYPPKTGEVLLNTTLKDNLDICDYVNNKFIDLIWSKLSSKI